MRRDFIPTRMPFFLSFVFICCISLASSSDVATSGKIADTFASFGQVEEINRALHPVLDDILHNTDFFGYYRLNLYEAQCPLSWSQEFPMCGNRACAVEPLKEEEIPEIWRASVLGQVTGPIATHPPYDPSTVPPATKTPLGGALGQGTAEMCIFETNEYDSERDYCIPEDETLASGWVYVSLVNNPERFTGYIGDHANAIWKEIYRENCFSVQPHHPEEDKYKMQSEWAKSDLEAVILGRNKARGNLDEDFNQLALETCLEKRVFWRIMSGMHTSISTHLCWDYLNQTTGQWAPNVDCFKSRVWDHPERLENLYFNYVIVLRALTKLSTYLESYNYCSGDPTQDTFTHRKVHALITTAQIAAPSFDESRMFDPHDPTISGLKAEFRQRFRNVSRIMDCVGCDKCRLWGKLQTNGYGTALKVLFEYDQEDNNDFYLRRTEVVSLIVTLQRLSHSIWAVEQFKKMISASSTPAEITWKDRLLDYWAGVKFNPLQEAFDEELGEIITALKFVLRSYIELPTNLWRMGVVFMARLWEKYVIGHVGIPKVQLNLDEILR